MIFFQNSAEVSESPVSTEAPAPKEQAASNRNKYGNLNRKPVTKITSTSSSTSTRTRTIVTPRSRNQSENAISSTKRLRRPGSRRRTTTPETPVEASNELPQDENYPRQPIHSESVSTSQPRYEENFEQSSRVVTSRTSQKRLHRPTKEHVSIF